MNPRTSPWQMLCRPAAAALSLACAGAGAAPLDALLSATRLDGQSKSEVELSYDLVNDSMDFLHLRDKPANGAGASSKPGDYRGFHIRGSHALGESWSIDGSLWQRQLDYRSFTADVTSWQVAGQYRWLDGGSTRPSAAWRLSAWGNRAPEMRKNTSTTIEGKKFSSAWVTQPRDTQVQADVIGTWPVASRLAVNAFAGAGAGRVDFDRVGAVYRKSGCDYQVAFSSDTIVATCTTPQQTIRITSPASVYGIQVDKEARYHTRYVHLGTSVRWQGQRWHAGAGYEYMHLSRSDIDDILVSRGETPYKTSNVLVVEGGWKAWSSMTLFARGQLMSNQFAGEIPMAYNSVTARRFNQRYGILSLGLNAGF
jgi:hypothetical protein